MNKHFPTYSIFEKLRNLLRTRGIRLTLKLSLVKVFLPLYSWSRRNETFSFEGKSFHYFFGRYNSTWDNERCVEIAIFMPHLTEHLKKGDKVLEVGNVLKWYFDGDGTWEIIDKFEKSPGVINEDVIGFTPKLKPNLILSVSTMEHVGYDDDIKNPKRAFSAIKHLKSILSPGGLFIFTVPLGYNKDFDKNIFLNTYKLSKVRYLKKISGSKWEQVDKAAVHNIRYDYPYSAANGLAICYVQKK